MLLLSWPQAGSAAPAGAPLRTVFDVRVDALANHALLTLPPRDLVDPARQRTARTVTDLHQVLFFFWAGAQIATFLWLWRSGRAARIRDWLRRHVRSRWAYRGAFGATLGVLAPLAGLPFAFIAYRIGFNVGLTEEIIGRWLLDYVTRALLDAAGAALTVAVVLELVDRTRLWYLAFLALIFTASVALVAVNPVIFLPLQMPLVRLAVRADAPVEIARDTERTRTLAAWTAGTGTFTRIIIGDVLLAVVTPPELRFALAHEDAHVRHADGLKLALVATTMLVFGIALSVLISDRVGFRRDDDPVSRLALVGAVLGAVALILLPFYNAYARGIEYRADEDARHRLHDPAGAVRFLVRRADHNLTPLCNRRSLSWYFADYPALGSRMAEIRGMADVCPHSPATR